MNWVETRAGGVYLVNSNMGLCGGNALQREGDGRRPY